MKVKKPSYSTTSILFAHNLQQSFPEKEHAVNLTKWKRERYMDCTTHINGPVDQQHQQLDPPTEAANTTE